MVDVDDEWSWNTENGIEGYIDRNKKEGTTATCTMRFAHREKGVEKGRKRERESE